MKEYTTNDEFDDADKAFFQAHTVLMTGVGDLEKAAATVTDYALTSGDRGAMNFFMARFVDFIGAGKLPPLPMRKGFRTVFNALLLPQKKGAPKTSMLKREWARTTAMVVSHFANQDDNLRENKSKESSSFEKAAVLRPGDSESKISRDYYKFRKLKK